MRALKAAIVIMGVMIIAGTALLVALIIRRASHPAPTAATAPTGQATLHQPQGTRIISLAATPTGLAVALQGGGPDRILILDPTTLRPTATITLTPDLPPALDPLPHLP
jgi:hypothetical protein